MSTRHESIDWGISGLTGTLGLTVVDTSLSVLIARTTLGIAEDGSSGCYALAIAGWDDAWDAFVRIDDGNSSQTYWSPSVGSASGMRTAIGLPAADLGDRLDGIAAGGGGDATAAKQDEILEV